MMSGKSEIFQIKAGGSRPHEESMDLVVSETFEKMGFMEAFVVEARTDLPADILCASLHIEVPEKGIMYFLAPRELAWSIAENLYGADELSSELVTDMIGELLNTICGKFLSEVIPDQEFTLSIPQVCPETPAWQEDMYAYSYNIENKGVTIIVLQPE